MECNELVSVRVVSYNAEQTILDTLESIKNQTYRNIELIVSDDCSKDKTVQIVREWLAQNKSRFVRTKLLTVDHNTGVCANMNRALKECEGVWIKGIAADDILLPNCVEDYMNFVSNNPNCRFVASLARVYEENFAPENYRSTMGDCSHIANRLINDQIAMVAFHHTINAPSCFYNKNMLLEIGGYDNKYGYEDHPLYLTILENGNALYYMPKETVGYRIHNSTVFDTGRLFKYEFVKQSKKFRKERCFKYYTCRQKLSMRMTWMCYAFFDFFNLNRNKKANRFFFRGIMSLIYRFGE